MPTVRVLGSRFTQTTYAASASAGALPADSHRPSFKQTLKTGKPSFGLFINSSSPTIAEQMAYVGYDWLLVDAQHSPMAAPQLGTMLGAATSNNTPAFVRVGSPQDRPGIQQAIDSGAWGVMIPTIKTADDARAAVNAAFFPPVGSRSIAFPIRPQLGRPVPEYLETANDEMLVMVQIETKECLDNLEEILAVPGVEAAFVGPFDLSFDLGFLQQYGYPAGMQREEYRVGVLQRIADACKAAGVVAGSFASPAAGPAELLEMGFTLIGTGTDLALLGKAAAEELQQLNALRKTQ